MLGRWGGLVLQLVIIYWWIYRYKPKVLLRREDFYPRHRVEAGSDAVDGIDNTDLDYH